MKRHCVTDRETEVFERLCLPLALDEPDESLFDKVPIFTPSLGQSGTALLNLSHTGFSGIHIIITTTSKMTLYMSRVYFSILLPGGPIGSVGN